MTPPFVNIGPGKAKVDSDAPVAHWNMEDASDSAAECEQQHMRLVKLAEQRAKVIHSTKNALISEQQLYAACVATDDPRLKTK
jgi:hypothetical protein